MMNEGLYVLQYSPETRNFLVEKLHVMLDKNQQVFTQNAEANYIPLGMFETLEELLEAKSKLLTARAKVGQHGGARVQKRAT